jgi:hypothetical protein
MGWRWHCRPSSCPQRRRWPPCSSRSSSRSRCQPALLRASRVYAWLSGTLPPLSPLYVGPYKVLERTDKCFRLAMGGREETVCIDLLKLHLEAGPFMAALPVACGHPPTSPPVMFQPQHPPAAATIGGTVAEYLNTLCMSLRAVNPQYSLCRKYGK